MKTIVKKFGGQTLSTPEKILVIAKDIQKQSTFGEAIVLVVSAMGRSTDELHQLSQKISKQPRKRELDMLLSTGERVSMALMSMALNELGCEAVSLTGSQAGVLTTDSHLNASIKNVTPIRIEKALQAKKIVVLAGFQGVSEATKEITTLGRGGTDITAMAIAIALKAKTCEILKDVAGLYTADPQITPKAKVIPELHFSHLLHMTFWGAKALNYRAAELAFLNNQQVLIGSALNSNSSTGTIIKGDIMFEQTKILSINSFEKVIRIQINKAFLTEALEDLKTFLDRNEIGFPQVLKMTPQASQTTFWLTGPQETMTAIESKIPCQKAITLIDADNTVVSTTHTTATSPDLLEKLFSKVTKDFAIQDILFSTNGAHFMLPQKQKKQFVESLHALIE